MVKQVLALVAALFVVTVGVAHAQDSYPPPDDGITVSVDVHVGGSITITAHTYQSGAPVTFTVNGQPGISGIGIANSSGIATFTATIPAGMSTGNHLAKAQGLGADGHNLTLTQRFTVLPGLATVQGETISRNALADGGSDHLPIAPIAIGVGAGAGLLAVVANRRRTAKAAATDTAGV